MTLRQIEAEYRAFRRSGESHEDARDYVAAQLESAASATSEEAERRRLLTLLDQWNRTCP